MDQRKAPIFLRLIAATQSMLGIPLFAVSVQAQTLPPLVSDARDVRETCHSLLHLPLMNGTVTSVAMEPASPFVASMRAPVLDDTPARPDHCLVRGVLNKRTGVDGKPYEIRFELRLPIAWNGRYFYAGGRGVDGVVLPADGAGFLSRDQPSALARGFAVVTTDSGHQAETGAENSDYLFGADPQARDEYGDQQLPMVHAAGLKVIARAYGALPVRSYFFGISNGGRQALMAAQRHPYLFDGIVSYASGFRLVQASLAGIYRAQLAAKIAPKKADGTPDIDHPLAPEKLQFISDQILKRCDGLDGVEDGMVFKSLSCPLDPMEWTCDRLRTKICLTPQEAGYVAAVIAGPRLRSGEPFYAPLASDPYLTSTLATSWMSFFPVFWGEASHIYTAPPTIGPDMMAYLLNSDLDAEYAKTLATTELYKRSGVEFTNADSPDMDAFMRHGGKLISVTGAADQAFSAVDAAAYQSSLFDRYGRTTADGFSRLFIIPGLGHGMPYAFSTSQVDLIAAIVDWAENNHEPDGLMAATRKDAKWPNRTRPLCAYPAITTYKGHGSIEDGHNFRCEEAR